MPLSLKQLVRTNIYGTEVWSTDKTGAYNASTNTGGYGAPNPELDESALLLIMQREDHTGKTVLVPITPQVVHNPNVENTEANAFGFTYLTDGHYISTLIRLRVSDDGGATDLAGAPIADGTYFAIGTTIYHREGGLNVLVEPEDYIDLIEDDSLTKSTCEVMFYNKLLIKARDYYKEFSAAREDAREDSESILFKMDELFADISGADYNFRSGLKTKAESIVKTLLEKHNIV